MASPKTQRKPARHTGFQVAFVNKWKRDIPSAVKCLQTSAKACLTFMDFPEDEWISLRTTNVIERLNKGCKRRTKPMEIVPGEAACYRLLAFVSLKMELHWRSNPVGKVRENLPFFKLIKQIRIYTRNFTLPAMALR